MIKIFIDASQYLFKQVVVIDYLADGMDHVTPFIVHIIAAFLIYSVRTYDSGIIANIGTQALCIGIACLFPILAFNKQGFRISSKSFMHPHIGNIPGGDAICKPFMTTFMYDDIIPFTSPASFRP